MKKPQIKEHILNGEKSYRYAFRVNGKFFDKRVKAPLDPQACEKVLAEFQKRLDLDFKNATQHVKQEPLDRDEAFALAEWRKYAKRAMSLGGTPPSLSELVRASIEQLSIALPTTTLQMLVDAYKEFKSSELKAGFISTNYANSIQYNINPILEHLNPCMLVDSITVDDIARLLSTLARTKRPYTVKNCRGALLSMFEWGVRNKLVQENVVFNTRKINIPKDEVVVITPLELKRLLDESLNDTDRTMTVLIALGAFCGIRTQELVRLSWEQLYLKGEESNIRLFAQNSKTKTSRVIPLEKACLAWIATADVKKQGNIIKAEDEDKAKDMMIRAIKSIAKRAGITMPRNALRHSYGTYACAVFEDYGRVSYRMGNSPSICKEHYNAVATKAMGEEWFAVMP